MTTKLLEIEHKRRLTSNIEDFIKKLEKFGFELQSKLSEIDTYYSRPDVDFMQTVECLRIRQRDGFAEVTYKPATTTATHTKNNVIIKPETNLPIQPEDAATAKQLLANLGMVQLVEVNKYRRSFQSSDFPQATVAIDEIKDAGTFVEVEVLSDDENSALKPNSALTRQKLSRGLIGIFVWDCSVTCLADQQEMIHGR